MNTTSTISRARSHVLRLLAVATIGTHGAAAIADVIHVPADQPTIQAGIDAAVDGDQVVIAPGTYAELINFYGKAIVVRSTDPMDPDVVAATILDGEGTGPVVTCDSGEGPNTVLRGLTVTNGVAAENGGGMYISACSPKVTDCVFRGNAAENAGGGMYYEVRPDGGEQVLRCEFTGNAAHDGAGMWLGEGGLPITGCTFANNSAARFGGGLRIDVTDEWVRDCTFTDNVAAAGGGMHVTYPAEVRGCTVIGNSATHGGGGLLVATGRVAVNSGIEDCSFWGNSAGPNVGGGWEYGGGGGGICINFENPPFQQLPITDCTSPILKPTPTRRAKRPSTTSRVPWPSAWPGNTSRSTPSPPVPFKAK